MSPRQLLAPYLATQATTTESIHLSDGDTYTLTASHVKKMINGHEVSMLAYNGSIPGPAIYVQEGSTITIHFVNHLNVSTTMHSHGIRLLNKYDGVPGVTQKEIKPGESFDYTITFKDPGVFWYHPHINEPYEQQLGLYGNFIVLPKNKKYFENVHKEVPIMLSDILLNQDGSIPPFPRDGANHVLMGRFGNVMLTNGTTSYTLSVQKNEVVRLYLTNAANTRVFNFALPGATMKRIGGDSGAYTKETFVKNIILGPSERAVVDVSFPHEGKYTINHITPATTYQLGTVVVLGETPAGSDLARFHTAMTNEVARDQIKPFERYITTPPEKTIVLSMEMGQGGMMQSSGGHMMQNGQMMEGRMMSGSGAHMMPDGTMMGNTEAQESQQSDIEWEDTMPMMNSMSTSHTILWKITDKDTGAINDAILWNFKVGDVAVISIVNDPKSMHAMQHPIHFHGQRFIVLSTNGIPSTDFVWKDTTLVKRGDTVKIALELSNPGLWMAHCHIAEHLSDGMMFNFNVNER